MSLGETALLQAAGADKADPSVRLLVDRETAQIAEDERSFLDFLIFWRDEDPAGEIVDPIKEAQRLRLNTALGKPVTEGSLLIRLQSRTDEPRSRSTCHRGTCALSTCPRSTCPLST